MTYRNSAGRRALAMMFLGFSYANAFGTTRNLYRSDTYVHQGPRTVLYDSENGVELPRRHGWKRAISRVLPLRRRRNPSEEESLTLMRMMLLEDAVTMTAPSNNSISIPDFVPADFERLTPLMVEHPDMLLLRDTPPSLNVIELLKSDLDAIVLEDPATSSETLTVPSPTAKDTERSQEEMGSLLVRLARHYSQNLLTGLIDRWTIEPPKNLEVRVTPRSNVLQRIMVGKFRGDAEVAFDRLVFKPIRLSSGTVQAKRMHLNLWSFTPDALRHGARRYPSQFDFHFKNCTFTEEDLFQSRCIRNGLSDLLVLIMERVGVKPEQVVVDSIQILPNGKISVAGSASLGYGANVPYEVRTGIDTASRGHILTFPGLEISLNPALNMFVPVVPEIDLDIGHNARVTDVEIGGAKKFLRFSGSATITPEHTVKLQNYIQSKASYLAQFNFDVGAWLTKLGRFTH